MAIKYNTYTFSVPSGQKLQVLPYNAERVSLIISAAFAAGAENCALLLEQGPLIAKAVDAGDLARSLRVPNDGGTAYTTIEFINVPANPITILPIQALACVGVILEGVMR